MAAWDQLSPVVGAQREEEEEEGTVRGKAEALVHRSSIQ